MSGLLKVDAQEIEGRQKKASAPAYDVYRALFRVRPTPISLSVFFFFFFVVCSRLTTYRGASY
jgi:hypothetical protein